MKILIFIAACSIICGCQKNIPARQADPRPKPLPKVSIVSMSGILDPSDIGVVIVGVIKNDSSETINGLEVDFDFYNDVGNKTDESSASIERLNSGETWQFQANSNAASSKYKIAGIRCILDDAFVNTKL